MTREELIEQIQTEVLYVLKPSGLGQWWHTPLPRFGNMTGEELLNAGRGEELLEHVKTYSNMDFS